jgi:thymidylate kinase
VAFKHDPPLIGIVGVCASGKSTLIRQLELWGFHCRHIAQEHSYVADMWQRLTNPDILVFLDVSYEKTLERKKLNWTREEFETQLERLDHARQKADILVDTDPLTSEEVGNVVVQRINLILENSI